MRNIFIEGIHCCYIVVYLSAVADPGFVERGPQLEGHGSGVEDFRFWSKTTF